MNEEGSPESAASTFLAKLKEQSFTIILMLGALYYQHTMWQRDHDFLLQQVYEWEKRNAAIIEAERTRMIEREKYLAEQRDQFVDMLKEEVLWKRAQKP